MTLREHPHVTDIRVQHEICGEELRIIAIVQTNLTLDPEHPDYAREQDSRNGLYNAIDDYAESKKYLHRVLIQRADTTISPG